MDIRTYFGKGVAEVEVETEAPEKNGKEIEELYRVGYHVKKEPTLVATIRSLPALDKGWQIFLGGPQNSKIAVKDADLEAASKLTSGYKIFVHSQYILNLSAVWEAGGWQEVLLQKNLEVSVAAGFRGVVIHVGKACKLPYKEALENMRTNLLAGIQHASSTCPLLLETPAGQGSETLQGMEEFCQFVAGFGDSRLGVCLDTCHVFAAGHCPIEYIQYLLDKHPGLLKLVHYNDSKDVCGSCKDRHAYVGTGEIGAVKMEKVASICSGAGIPMVIE